MQVSATDVAALTAALRSALEGGPAVWPVADPGPRAEEHPVAEVDDRVALVVETSGSTDAPKRVLLSADALCASARATEAALSGPGQWLLALPAHYIAGAQVLVRSIVAGTDPVLLEGERFDPGAFAAASARLDPLRPRYTSLVPVQLSRLVDAAKADPKVADALRAYDRILLGGQAAPPALIVAADALGVRVTRTYGSSETAGGCVYDGRPLDGVTVRIADPSAGPGRRGLVELNGPMLADGYLGDPERTADAFTTDPDGTRWYRTGDLGDLAPDGTLRIRGRADDVIISGGVKVALGEVERAIRGVAGFDEAVVVRLADPEWGERPAVVVEGADAAASAASETTGVAAVDALETTGVAAADALETTEVAASAGLETTEVAASAALHALAEATDAAGLPPAARPVRLELVERMPLLASGKPDRRALEARLRDAREHEFSRRRRH